MKTPLEELAALTAELDDLKTKVVKLKSQEKAFGFSPSDAQVYEVQHRISILESRIEMLRRQV